MNWLDQLMEDIDVELILEKIHLDMQYERFMGRSTKALAEKAERIRKARSPEMIARMEAEWRMKLARARQK